jgi:NADH-quinone oxidoreductase subunit A
MESGQNEVLTYLPLLVLIGVSTIIALAMIGLSTLFGPKKPNAYKSTSYECGMTPIGSARERFPIKFYLIAMLFIVFDIETIFLYPWAVTFREQGHSMKIFYFVEMIVFVVILFVGYFYILGKGALDWDESERAVTQDTFTKETLAPRAPIIFGNEDSGPVRRLPTGERAPSYGASSQEEGIS